MISAIYKFREDILESSQNVSETAPASPPHPTPRPTPTHLPTPGTQLKDAF